MEKGFALALVVLCAVLRSSKFQHNKRAALQSPRSWDAVSGPLTHASRTRTEGQLQWCRLRDPALQTSKPQLRGTKPPRLSDVTEIHDLVDYEQNI